LLQATFPGQNLDRRIDNPIFQTQEQVQISQAKIRIHHRHPLIALRQGHAKIGRCGTFAHATFTRGDNNNSSHA
jgi:hypothetical protein